MMFAVISSRKSQKLLLATTAITSVLASTAAPNAADINLTTNSFGPIVLETLRGGGGTVDVAAGVIVTNSVITPIPTNFAFSDTLSGLSTTGVITTSRWTITNAGTIDNTAPFGPFTLPTGTVVAQVVPRAINIAGGLVTNLAGATITSTGDAILIGNGQAQSQSITVDNAGLIRGASFRGIGVFDPGGTVQTVITNRSTGRIESGGTAIVAGSNNTVIDNAGLIQGVNLSSPATLSTTSRLGDGRFLRDVFGATGYGVVVGGGTITNRAGATISGATASGILIGAAINATAGYFSDPRFGVGTVINDGTISSVSFAAIGATRSANITNNASGTIISTNGNAIVVGTGYNLNNPQFAFGITQGGPGSVTNSGTISAGGFAVQLLNPGGALVNNAGGRITGGTGGVVSHGLVSLVNRGNIITTLGAGVGLEQGEFDAGPTGNPGTFVLTNSGQIQGGAQSFTTPFNLQSPEGFFVAALDAVVPNDGFDITVHPFIVGAGLVMSAYPANVPNTPTINNEASGQISGGFGGILIADKELDPALLQAALPANAVTINNAGAIRSTTAGFGIGILGNATINNNTGGVIEGRALNTTLGVRTIGLLVTDTGLITNAGAINGDVRLGAVSTLTNSGTINGTVEFTGSGNNTVTLRTGSVIGGTVDAGAGTDTLALEGAGTAANTFSNFEALIMRGTEWTLTGNSTFGSISVQSGFLTVNGQLTNGAGAVTLGANSGLRGVGRVMNSVSNTGGTVTPAGAGTFGTLTIQGDYTQGTAGRLVIDANDAGTADRLTVTGRATLGGTLQIAAVDGQWSTQRSYTIVNATSGVSGTFATVEQNLAYLTPMLTYGANDVTLALSRKTEEIQQAITQETTEQAISTSTRKTTATVESRIDQVIAIAFPIVAPAPSPSAPPSSPSEPSGTPGQDNNNGQRQDPQQQSMSGGAARGLSAGDAMSGWGMWATVSPTYVNQDLVLPGQTGATRVKGHTWDMFVGADKLVGERAVVGAVVGYEDTSYDLKTNGGERKASGPMVVGYAGVLFTDWLYATGQVTQAWFDNDLAEATFGGPLVRGEFGSRRTTGSISITARHAIEKVNLAGKVGYSYTREKFDAYTTSDKASVAADRTRLGRLTIGGEAVYRGDTIMPYVNATFERDVNPPRGPGDIEGLVLGGGFRYMGGRFTVDAYGNAETGRAGESAVTLGLNVRFTF